MSLCTTTHAKRFTLAPASPSERRVMHLLNWLRLRGFTERRAAAQGALKQVCLMSYFTPHFNPLMKLISVINNRHRSCPTDHYAFPTDISEGSGTNGSLSRPGGRLACMPCIIYSDRLGVIFIRNVGTMTRPQSSKVIKCSFCLVSTCPCS